MPTTGVAPLAAALAAKKRIAADRCEQRAAKLRSEAAALVASQTKKTPTK